MTAVPLNAREIIRAMRAFRARTLALTTDLNAAQLIGPRISVVNPPLWEIGHVAWFQEFWVLRHLRRQRPLLETGDRLYNSTDVAHDSRWELLLPTREETLRYMDMVLENSLQFLEGQQELSPEELYFHLLAIFHEGMHAEALAYTRQTLSYAAPVLTEPPTEIPGAGGSCPGDVEVPGGTFSIGAAPDFPYVFDNEKWVHEVEVKPFRIARAPVTNGEYLAFVEDGGYHKEQYWSAAGWRWLKSRGVPGLERSFATFFNGRRLEPRENRAKPSGNSLDERPFLGRWSALEHPIYWHRSDAGEWQQRIFDRFVPLEENLPVVHLSWYEAEAYCNWAARRLPSEAEWEIAASADPADSGRSHRRHFPWGDEAPSAAHANLDWRAGGLAEVGAYPQGDSAFGCRQMIGNVWEWTADDFQPYPGFTPDPYKEYSKPWFGTHKVLRGGCWATSSLLIRNTWRNFYTPDRDDVWAGFRTCAK
ncbi:MAG TPA: selenoneine synthase SenA [Candidatus Binatia bacterium]|nr:selenoneine synthase SenA [Candidatus Binatia bacterium]